MTQQLEDTTLNEVQCYECGKPMSSIPPWLAGAKVKFQCEECRQKHPRVPGMAELEPRHTAADADDVAEIPDTAEDAEDEVDDEAEEVDDFAE